MEMGVEGIGRGAHGGCRGGLGVLGDILVAANRAAAIAGHGGEDGGDGVASGHPVSRASA